MDKPMLIICIILIVFGTLNIVTASSREAAVNLDKWNLVSIIFQKIYIFNIKNQQCNHTTKIYKTCTLRGCDVKMGVKKKRVEVYSYTFLLFIYIIIKLSSP